MNRILLVRLCLPPLLLVAAGSLAVVSSVAQRGAKGGEWRYYGADAASAKYSPLDQINRNNVKRLRIAWRWTSPDSEVRKANPGLATSQYFQATPLMVGGVLYTSTSFSLAAAIDAATGKTLWVYDPQSYKNGRPPNRGFLNRGVAYWENGGDKRVFLTTGDAYLIALDAKTGQPIPTFGNDGRIDLTQGLRWKVERKEYSVDSPPVICRNVVVVGSVVSDFAHRKRMPPGDVRGFDARSGKPLWTFHTVPQEGEFGAETWLDESWRHTGNANVWSLMSADEELGYVYLPVATPTNDFYGGNRLGDGLFGTSLVCLEARTGKRVWHFQFVHHDLWDYDPPAAPNLVDLRINGRKVRAVAQVTKQGFTFVFDRVTGKPIWPITERPVPRSTMPGEASAPTQPAPLKPPPFETQGVTENELIDLTPELRAEAIRILKRYDYGPLYTPPTERGAIVHPGIQGGANWGGAAVDPETGILYVPSITRPFIIALKQQPSSDYERGYAVRFDRSDKVKAADAADYVQSDSIVNFGPRGLPLLKPPFGRITAIDLNKGEILWQVPNGDGPRRHTALKDLKLPRLGWSGRSGILCTRTLLFLGQGPAVERTRIGEPRIRAYDKATGELVWEEKLPAFAYASPMTYLINGEQYIVIAAGGGDDTQELIAFNLP